MDYETPADQSIALMVKVNDGFHSDDVEITINVTDINDNAPTLTANNNKTTASLAEQTAAESVDTGITFTAGDVDTNTSFSASDFTVSGDDRFEVVADGNNWKLQLKAGKTLNYETPADQSIALKVKVSDGVHSSEDVDVTISVTDVNDAPVFDPNSPVWFFEDGNVPEDTAVSIPLAAFWASDEDGDAVTYRIVSGASSRFFEIDETAGVLTIKKGLDYESDTSHTLTIEASDGNDIATTEVKINVTYTNDEAPHVYVRSGGSSSGRIEEQTTPNLVYTGCTFGFNDDDAGTIFTADSFTITGTDGNVDDRFVMVNEYRNQLWGLYLKAGVTLDYDNVADRHIDLTITVSDEVNVNHMGSPLTRGFFEGEYWTTATVRTLRHIDGTSSNNVIEGGFGPENIYGKGGNDTLYGGSEKDSLYGSVGHDTLYGGAGKDILLGEYSNDTLYGGAGKDILLGEYSNDTLYGGAGDDLIEGGSGNDTFYGGKGRDEFEGDESDDLFYLDTANAELGIPNAEGGDVHTDIAVDFSRGGTDGMDRIIIEVSKTDKAMIGVLSTDQEKLNKLMELADIRWEKEHNNLRSINLDDRDIKNTLFYDTRGTSGTDDDIILMMLEDFEDDLTFDMFQIVVEDIITGTSSAETLSGTGRNSTISGGGGVDTIYDDAGDDIIRGDAGNDILYGGEDNDSLYGGSNNDTLHGEGGVDILRCNSGNDRFVLDIVNAGTPDVDIVADFSRSGNGGIDVIRVDTSSGNETSFAALGLRTAEVTNKVVEDGEIGENDGTKKDTIIYHTNGTATDTSDDFALMVLEDFTGLTFAMVDVI